MSDKAWGLSEDSWVSVSMVVLIIGFAAWLTTIHANTSANTKSIDEITSETRENEKFLREMTERLGRIEGKLDLLRSQQKR